MLLRLTMLLCALLPASAPGLQDPPPKHTPKCIKCKSTGLIPCSKHPKTECELEHDVLYCSVVADCEQCDGAAFLDCPRCENPVAQKRLAEKLQRVESSREKLKWIDDTWNEGRSANEDHLRKVETEHFVLVWEMEGMKVGRKSLTPHEMMHLYAERLEQQFTDYLKAFQARERDFTQKSTIFIWYLPQDQVDGSLRFCSSGAKSGVKLMGSTSRYSVCGNRQFFKGDEELHRNVMHSVGHLLLSHQNPSAWLGDKKYGWADEGIAHWFEDLYFGICTNYCYQEQNSNVGFKSGKYRVAVRKMVATGNQPLVAQVFSRTTQDLPPREHAVAFSYVDYLLNLDGAKFNKLLQRLKTKEPTREALKDLYDLNPMEFEARWKAWVLETYPTR